MINPENVEYKRWIEFSWENPTPYQNFALAEANDFVMKYVTIRTQLSWCHMYGTKYMKHGQEQTALWNTRPRSVVESMVISLSENNLN